MSHALKIHWFNKFNKFKNRQFNKFKNRPFDVAENRITPLT